MMLTAIILGLTGSLHCAGMCSPLAFAVFSKSGTVVFHRVLYNVGRILMYCVFGFSVSAMGVMLPLPVQYAVSITLGVIFLVIGITGHNFKAPSLAPALRFTSFLKAQFSRFLQDKKRSSIFFMGMLNGLLPCGLTFLALTSCLTLNKPIDGFIFMAGFGAGTLPVMLGLVSIIPFLTRQLNFSAGRLSMILQIAAGCLLIARVLLVEPHVNSTTQSDPIVICK
jgi:uncharacterized protein